MHGLKIQMPTGEKTRIEDILEGFSSYQSNDKYLELIKRVYIFSATVHKGQLRYSGEPYLIHPLEVANILVDLKMDVYTICAGLLHDTIEDTLTTLGEIEKFFGKNIAFLVDGVTKIAKLSFNSAQEQEAETFRKMILAMAKDIRVIIIKLADRLHNMRTLDYLPKDKRRKIAQETRDIYAPFASRLGMGKIKWELEDIALKHLKSDIYYELKEKVERNRAEREQSINTIKQIVEKELQGLPIEAIVQGRPKHFYSIYRKMKTKNISFEEVFDLVGLRIITNTVKDCYTLLGLIHSLWKPIPGEFDDYIAMPKPNMYQSLHTAIIGHEGKPVEFQIRTKEMHKTAEEGIAAHWQYKEDGVKIDEKHKNYFVWLKQLLEWQQEVSDPKEFMEGMKMDLVPTEIYVFTPKGDIKALPIDATPVDFAYMIHSEIGNTCAGAKVNGKIVPLKYKLKTGDIVAITTSPKQTPSRDWLKFVKTQKAKQKIKKWLKEIERERSLQLGKELIDKGLRREGHSLAKATKSGKLAEIAKQLGFYNEDELFISTGYGKLSPNQVIHRILPPETLKGKKKLEAIIKKPFVKRRCGITVKGESDIMVNIAKCCNPVLGEKIIGFITLRRGISIHSADCPNVTKLSYNPDRIIEVEWNREPDSIFTVHLKITAHDRPGLLADISGKLSSNETNIVSLNARVTETGLAVNDLSIHVRDIKHLKKTIQMLKNIKGIIEIQRVKSRTL